jgi:Vanadium chloroperoxidase N-terminal domain
MNSVLYWNSVLLEASRRDFTKGYVNGQQPGPIRTSRAMAIVHLAIHDAVGFRNQAAAAYLNKGRHARRAEPHRLGRRHHRGRGVTALKEPYPAYAAYFDDAVGAVSSSAFNGGAKVAMAILAHRATDGSTVSITGPQPCRTTANTAPIPTHPDNRNSVRYGEM